MGRGGGGATNQTILYALLVALASFAAFVGMTPARAAGAAPIPTGTCAFATRLVLRSTAAGSDITTFRPDTSAPVVLGHGGDPVVSPDGRLVGWVGDDLSGSQHGLLVAEADGTSLRNISAGDTAISAWAWSPTSHDLVWLGRDAGSGLDAVFAAPANGLGPVREIVTTSWTSPSAPAVSADGTHVAWTANVSGSTYSVYTAAVDGTDQRQTTPLDYASLHFLPQPVWSPVNAEVAFVVPAPSSAVALQVAPAASAGAVQTVHTEALLYMPDGVPRPVWRPDGGAVAMALNLSGPTGVLGGSFVSSWTSVVAPDGSWSNQVEGGLPAWSPDGTHLALAYDRYENSVGMGPLLNTALLVTAPDGTGVQTLPGTPRIKHLEWSRDSSSIAFGGEAWFTGIPGWFIQPSYLHDQSGITVVGSGVVTDAGWRTDPAWAPDGTHVAFRSRTDNIPVVISPDGTGALSPAGFTTATAPQWAMVDCPAIAGVVTDDAGAPTEGVTVSVLETWPSWKVVQTTRTDAAGHYAFVGLPAGTYRIRFFDGQGRFARTWYGNGTTYRATGDVAVTDGPAGAVADQSLAPRPTGELTGHVQADVIGLGLGGIVVQAFTDQGLVAAAVTDPGGTYHLRGLDPGTYRVRFVDPTHTYRSEFHTDQPTPVTADPVVVSSTPVTIDEHLGA